MQQSRHRPSSRSKMAPAGSSASTQDVGTCKENVTPTLAMTKSEVIYKIRTFPEPVRELRPPRKQNFQEGPVLPGGPRSAAPERKAAPQQEETREDDTRPPMARCGRPCASRIAATPPVKVVLTHHLLSQETRRSEDCGGAPPLMVGSRGEPLPLGMAQSSATQGPSLLPRKGLDG